MISPTDATILEAKRQLDAATKAAWRIQREYATATVPERADILPRLEIANQYRSRCWGRYFAAKDPATQAANEVLKQERDEARRELRASQWLTASTEDLSWWHVGYPYCCGCTLAADCATALGWKDCPDADPGIRSGDASGTNEEETNP